MLSCDHQFRCSKDSDWLITNSASCPIEGNTGVSTILQQLMEKHCLRDEDDKSKYSETDSLISSDTSKQKKEEFKKQKSIDLSLYSQPDSSHYKISRYLQEQYGNNFDLDDYEKHKRRKKKKRQREKGKIEFDESQHLDGCPLKWYYRKQSLDSVTSSRCLRNHFRVRPQTTVLQATPTLKDCVPREMNIHKIRLSRRDLLDNPPSPPSCVNSHNKISQRQYRKNSIESGISSKSSVKTESSRSVEEVDSRLDTPFKKNLAIKLNWRKLDMARDEPKEESSDPRNGYLPPRPLLGLKPLLSILLSPRQHSPCCTVNDNYLLASRNDTGRSKSASLSIKLLDLPEIKDTRPTRPKTTYSLRWGSRSLYRLRPKIKTCVRIHIPNTTHKDSRLLTNRNVTFKDITEVIDEKATKQQPIEKPESTNSRFAELYFENISDWTRKRVRRQTVRYFDDLTDNIEAEDKEIHIQKFLNSNMERVVWERIENEEKVPERMPGIVQKDVNNNDNLQLNVVCSKVQFFERPGKPMK